MDAIVLAGALNDGPLRAVSSAAYEAEIEIAGKPMVAYVLEALNQMDEVERIAVVGYATDTMLPYMTGKVCRVDPGDSMIDSLIKGLELLQPINPVLAVTSVFPLTTPEAIRDFLVRCQDNPGDVCYSFVSKDHNEARYPGVQRTYVKLRDGVFTGGNIVLLSPEIVRERIDILKQAAALRKKPVQLCSLLGWKYLIKFIFGLLTIKEVEERVSRALGLKAVGIISPYPEVGIDVDKPSDLELATKALAQI